MQVIASFRTVALSLAVSLALAGDGFAQARTSANAIIDDMIKALGGQAFLDVDDIQLTGRYFAFKRGDLETADIFADYIKFPDKERTEFGKDKNKSITINRGKEGWMVEGKDGKKVEAQSPGQASKFLLEFQTSFDYVTRFVLDLPKTTMQQLGTEMIDFKRADVIEVRDPSKNLMRIYVERGSHLPMKMQIRRADEANVHEELYNNWHVFQGIMTPLLITRSTNGLKTMEIRVENASYDTGMADALFAPPTPAK